MIFESSGLVSAPAGVRAHVQTWLGRSGGDAAVVVRAFGRVGNDDRLGGEASTEGVGEGGVEAEYVTPGVHERVRHEHLHLMADQIGARRV